MKTEISLDGEQFFINGRPTYEGVRYKGKAVGGLLMNSRMIQAVTDDENPVTRKLWAYPDSGVWDPERNTREFCESLPEYRRFGLLAVTIGLQAGGSVYREDVWSCAETTAFRRDGSFKDEWKARVEKVLASADDCGMAVIVNFFYWKQIGRIAGDRHVVRAVEEAMDFLLRTGRRNILVDIANESADWWGNSICAPAGIARLIGIAKAITLNGRRLSVSSSTGGDNLQTGAWLKEEDFSLPHGNGNTPERLRQRLRRIRETDEFRDRPRPLLVNEDSVNLPNLEAAVEERSSWGYYSQGAGSGDPGYEKIWPGGREKKFEDLSGFQTLPVNWGINTEQKKDFFGKIAEITGAAQ